LSKRMKIFISYNVRHATNTMWTSILDWNCGPIMRFENLMPTADFVQDNIYVKSRVDVQRNLSRKNLKFLLAISPSEDDNIHITRC